ncbi:SusC/RagA family TonB-linked outer membrane protein [Chryseobacterium sp.]|uniref:SusC/RagA family TonB-linked outer membrane protein n=1 Tax=Chryseobacterium sp. TaxID=1871047 RepID=UPI0025B88554|nr:SusC/RagA family TonB-linked outer membrane protein [Chryseobacterium sp.]
MKKLTTSVLTVVLASSFMVVNAQNRQNDTVRTQDIREVVVTGALGIKMRQDAVISSNKVVGTKEINQASSPNMAQALTGKVNGLQINNTNNSVNSSNRIVLRGPRSMYGDSQALVVIDGAISTLSIFQQLPPEVVESVNVIKGQQGSALYGEKGSNGVIVVTTKKGSKSSKIQFNLTSSIDISDVYKLPIRQKIYGQGIQDESFDDTDYGGTNWVPYENTSWGPLYSSSLGGQLLPAGLPQADGSFIMTTFSPKKDNIKKFFNNGVTYQNGLSMNVGGDDSYAFLSINRLENNFMIDGDQLKRNTFFFKGGKQIEKFRIDGTFNFIDQNVSQSTGNLYGMLLQTPTNINVKDYRNSGLEGHWTGYAYNPYWLRDHYRSNSNSTTFNGIVSMNYDFTKNISLSYTGNMLTTSGVTEAYNDGYSTSDAYVYSNTGTFLDGMNFFEFGSTPPVSGYNKLLTKGWKYYGDIMLNFNYDLSDNVALKANIGNNIQDTKQDNAQVGGTNLKIPGWYNINNVLQNTPWYNLDNSKLRQRSVAWFANADISYKDFLFVNGTFRYEQSSVLSVIPTYTNDFKNNGYAYYSFGASFIPTKAFAGLKGDVLNYMKIAASYTRTGNSVVSPYAVDEVGAFPTGYPFGSLASYLYNPNGVSKDIKPEFNNTVEGNLSLGFFQDRITLDASAYQTDTDNLITRVTYPSSSGIASLLGNIGKMRNRGFEIELGLTPFKSKDFEWNLKGGYSQYRSKVQELADGQDMVILASAGSGIPASIAAIKGYDTPMIIGTAYQRDPNGNIIVDANGLPVVSSTPEILGKVNPDYILTFSTSIRFKSLTLTAVGDYRTGNKFISAAKNLLGFTGGLEKSAEFDRSQGYIIPGSVQFVNGQYVTNTTPVYNMANYAGVTNYFTSNYQDDIAEEFVVDGSALKIREIALSYALPKSLLANTFINNMSIVVYARNPFISYAKSNRNYGDPEVANTTGLAAGFQAVSQYPTSRSFGFNVNVNF